MAIGIAEQVKGMNHVYCALMTKHRTGFLSAISSDGACPLYFWYPKWKDQKVTLYLRVLQPL